jgi:hypothetical protein
MANFHGYGPRHYVVPPLGASFRPGRFGRMFPEITEALAPSDAALEALGLAMVDNAGPGAAGDNANISAGFTYLGQFVDHDITLDTTTLNETAHDPDAVENFRTPRLDLDCLYGLGNAVNPWLMDRNDRAGARMLLGRTVRGAVEPNVKDGLEHDLPRTRQGRALIGDHRNDENLLVAQTHVAFIRFHNAIVEKLRGSVSDGELFDISRKTVIAHYQAMVLRDFLTKLCDVNDVAMAVNNGPSFFRWDRFSAHGVPFMPVEFSVAAYRLGHSMVRQVYNHNRVFRPGGPGPGDFRFFFIFSGLSGNITGPDGVTDPPHAFPQVPSLPSDWIIDWRRYFDFQTNDSADGFRINLTRRIDPGLATELHSLPGSSPTDPDRSLAVRNLKRGRMMKLPSGQAIARFMGERVLTPDEVASGIAGGVAAQHGLHVATPLWFYILKEAEVLQQGERLGPVGSRIVAETFVGLLRGDPDSILSRNPGWRFGSPIPGLDAVPNAGVSFTMQDLIAVGAGGRSKAQLSPVDDPAHIGGP